MARVGTRPHGRDQAGFTLIEVLLAMFILAVGILSTISMVNAGATTTRKNKARDGATNIARQVIETARAISYDDLQCAANTCVEGGSNQDQLITALQTFGQRTVSGVTTAGPLADSVSGGLWNVTQRNITYTISPVVVCRVDDPKDGLAATHDATYCSTNDYSCTSCGDDNDGDDYRRAAVTVSWDDNAGGRIVTRTVNFAGLINNPTGGLGPPLAQDRPCLAQVSTAANATASSGPVTCPSPALSQTVTWDGTGAQPQSLFFRADTISSAASVNWQVSNGDNGVATAVPTGQATGWDFVWNIPPVTATTPTDTNCVTPTGILDGKYLVSAFAFSNAGIAGDARTTPVTLDRYPPNMPCKPIGGGINDRTGAAGTSPVVEIEWSANKEADITGYKVYWVDPATNGLVAVCGASTPIPKMSCIDSGFTAHITSSCLVAALQPCGQYVVSAVDNGGREGPKSPPITITPPMGTNDQPTTPQITSVTYSGGQPTLTWNASTDGDDGANPILYYRIYRDGTSASDRYVTTTDTSWSDPAPDALQGAGAHTYWVSAVDLRYNESELQATGVSP